MIRRVAEVIRSFLSEATSSYTDCAVSVALYQLEFGLNPSQNRCSASQRSGN